MAHPLCKGARVCMYVCGPAALCCIGRESTVAIVQCAKRVENQPMSEPYKTHSPTAPLVCCVTAAARRAPGSSACTLPCRPHHHPPPPGAQPEPCAAKTAHCGRQPGETDRQAGPTVSAQTRHKGMHSRSCPRHTRKGCCACICLERCSGCSCVGATTHSPCLPPHTLQMLLSCCTVSARGIRSST